MCRLHFREINHRPAIEPAGTVCLPRLLQKTPSTPGKILSESISRCLIGFSYARAFNIKARSDSARYPTVPHGSARIRTILSVAVRGSAICRPQKRNLNSADSCVLFAARPH